MAWFVGQSLLFVVVAFVLGLLVGWLWWGRRRPAPAAAVADGPTAVLPEPTAVADGPTAVLPEPAPTVATVEESAPAVVAVEESAPAVVAADEPTAVLPTQASATGPLADVLPASPPPDDELERIEGIGPKMAGALRAAGIRTYAALAGSDEATLRTAIENAGLSFAPSLVTWARQARLLADGDEDGFAELTRRLVAGRDTGRL